MQKKLRSLPSREISKSPHMVWCKDGDWIVPALSTDKEHWLLELREKTVIWKWFLLDLVQCNVKVTIFHFQVFVFYLFGFGNLKIKDFFP